MPLNMPPNMPSMHKNLVVTMGDPAGIGPEIIVKCRKSLWDKSVESAEYQQIAPFYVLGDVALFTELATLLACDFPIIRISQADDVSHNLREIFQQGLPVWDMQDLSIDAMPISMPAPIIRGKPTGDNGTAIYQLIACAHQHIRQGLAYGMVTAPIAKEICQQAGFKFSGHTDYLADLAGKKQVVMMLANHMLKVVPLTVHIPLADVPKNLTAQLIISQARIVHQAMQQQFGISQPILAMAGLNPHAGENGMFGMEEQDIITPALEKLRTENIDIRGPFAGDSMFTADMRQSYDVVLACYHDQALIPLKTLDMVHGVNITLGLDFIRTSPDHGTAFDIADRLIASPDSMMAALKMATQHHG